MRNKILIIVGCIIVLVYVIGLILPSDFSYEQSIVINAPSEMIINNVKSLKTMDEEWSPWAVKDPGMIKEYDGKDGEVGSIARWKGNDQVGEGEQEIKSITADRVETEIRFKVPFEGVSLGYFQLTEGENGVNTAWGFSWSMPVPMNIFALFGNTEEEIGQDFTDGLLRLKTLCEQQLVEISDAESAPLYEVNELDVEAKTYFVYKEVVAFGNIATFYGTHFPALFGASAEAGLTISGKPTGLFWNWDLENGTADMGAAVCIIADDSDELEGYERIDVSGKALTIDYYGTYEKSEKAHRFMMSYLEQNDLRHSLVTEEYITDPTKEKDTSKWLTRITYLLESDAS